MVSRTIDDMELRRYLLGTLSEEEEAHQEERLLTEESYFERLVLAEDDLIDDYVRGKLSAEEKEGMEQRFLSSAARQERLRIARDLVRYTSAKAGLGDHERDSDQRHVTRDGAIPRIPRSGRRAAITLFAGAALLVIAAAVLLVGIARLNTRIEGLSQEQTKAQQREADLNKELAGLLQRQEQLSIEIEKEQRQRVQLQEDLIDLRRTVPASRQLPATDLLAQALTPGRIRDRGEAAILEIPPSPKKWVRLKLSLEQGGHITYRARLQTDEAKTIWTDNDLQPLRINNDERVDVVFPARLLVPGDYTVLLSPTGGRERIGTYYFTAVRKRQ